LINQEIQIEIDKARELISDADAILITAGAGMGVDSGLPDFRGNEGFWQAYPVAKARGLSFEAMANPEWFESDPTLAWAFYGHRLNLYRDTVPHEGFMMLRDLCKSKGDDYFILTSNVDGQFQKAGFDQDKICEIHGSIHHLQCTKDKDHGIWSAYDENLTVDMKAFKALAPLPVCAKCGSTARPNILMFGDWDWIGMRSDAQMKRFGRWKIDLMNEKKKVCVIEIGAGTAIASIRRMSESTAKQFHTPLIRINPRESKGFEGTIKLPMGGLEGIRQIIPDNYS
jgi:NAD-dependent SIR2 family protein deacetylase